MRRDQRTPGRGARVPALGPDDAPRERAHVRRRSPGPVAFEQPRRGALAGTTQLILARWFAKTAVLLQAAAGRGASIAAADRHALRRGLPETFAVHLARLPRSGARIDRALATGERVSSAVRLGDLVGVVHHGSATRPARPLLRIGPTQRRQIAWDQLPSVRSLDDALRVRAWSKSS